MIARYLFTKGYFHSIDSQRHGEFEGGGREKRARALRNEPSVKSLVTDRVLPQLPLRFMQPRHGSRRACILVREASARPRRRASFQKKPLHENPRRLIESESQFATAAPPWHESISSYQKLSKALKASKSLFFLRNIHRARARPRITAVR